jgi:hypothetical protein
MAATASTRHLAPGTATSSSNLRGWHFQRTIFVYVRFRQGARGGSELSLLVKIAISPFSNKRSRFLKPVPSVSTQCEFLGVMNGKKGTCFH